MTTSQNLLAVSKFSVEAPSKGTGTVEENLDRNTVEDQFPDGNEARFFSGTRSDKNQDFVFTIVLLYLLVPSVIILLWFSGWPILAATAAVGALFWTTARPKYHYGFLSTLLVGTWPYIILSASVVWIMGVLPPFAQNSDWFKHYAIFNALTDNAWPPRLITGDGFGTLRYYLAYYAVPSLAGKFFGRSFLSIAIFSWTTLGIYLALVLAFGWRERAMASVFTLGSVFLLFSGADFIGTKYTGVSFGPPMHFEWWWKPFGQLSSNITNLFWAPQHAIAGFLSTFLFVRHPTLALRNAGVIAAASAGWSPFAAIGLIPSLLWAVSKFGYREVFSRSNLICSPILLALSASFLTKGAETLPFGAIWNVPGFTFIGLVLFLMLEVYIFSLSLAIASKHNIFLIVIHSFFLTVLTLFTFGKYNDLLMRASIGSLGVLAFSSSVVVVYATNGIRKAPLIIFLVFGLITPFGEIIRSISATSRIQNIDEISIEYLLSGKGWMSSQYIVYEKSKPEVIHDDVLNLSKLSFHRFGVGKLEEKIKRVESIEYTDAALVSNDIFLPPGVYRLDAILDWDVSGGPEGMHGAHVSIHGKRILVPIMPSRAVGERVSCYFRVGGDPFKLSFGLGGWSIGKGFIHLKELKIGLVEKE